MNLKYCGDVKWCGWAGDNKAKGEEPVPVSVVSVTMSLPMSAAEVS